jgi:hypothetical protein
MANQFKSVVLAQLGDLPPATRAGREIVYDRLRAELAAMAADEQRPAEHAEHTLALEQAIEAVEAELQSAGQSAPVAAPVAADAAQQQRTAANGAATRTRKVAGVVAAAAIAILAAGAWYFIGAQRDAPQVSSTVIPQKDANADAPRERDLAASDKARSFQEALRAGDAATAAFLLQSGYTPTRVELRAALLEVKYSPQIKATTLALAADIRDIACGFTTFQDVRRPMMAQRLFDAEDAFAIMKQMGQDEWKLTCAADAGKWRAALAKIEQHKAQYNKPDAEKQQQAEVCIRRFSSGEAMERWEQANCAACPESHSNCESYCPKAPKPADAEEARFFSFNRSDMFMAGTASRKPNSSRAELYCNLQHLTRATDFDLANLQRFRTLVSLFE